MYKLKSSGLYKIRYVIVTVSYRYVLPISYENFSLSVNQFLFLLVDSPPVEIIICSTGAVEAGIKMS